MSVTEPSPSAPRAAHDTGDLDARASSQRNRERGWPAGAAEQAVSLQRLLAIGDRDWHALKQQRPRRAAEQLAAALVQLLQADDPRQSQAGSGRTQAIALVEHALGWLKAELSDPGCPQHGPRPGARTPG